MKVYASLDALGNWEEALTKYYNDCKDYGFTVADSLYQQKLKPVHHYVHYDGSRSKGPLQRKTAERIWYLN